MSTPTVTPWPFYGRDAEFEMLTRVASAEDRALRGAAVLAEAGVGKTRLLHRVGELARSHGSRVITVCCTPSSSRTPLLVADHLLSTHSDARRGNVFRQCIDEFAPDRPLILIDDAHFLDPDSAALVMNLMRAEAIRVIAGVRRDMNPEDSVSALWKGDDVVRIYLGTLARDEVIDVVTQALGGPIDTGSAFRFADMTGGNARYLRTLVNESRHTGALHRDHDVWTWDGQIKSTPALEELVDERLRGLSNEEREALAVIAFGEPLAVPACTKLLDIDVLSALEAAGLVEVSNTHDDLTMATAVADGEAVVRLVLPLFREVIIARSGPLQCRRILARLATAPQNADLSHQSRMTLWRLKAGVEISDTELVNASFAATDIFSFTVAERLAREAIRRSAPASELALALALVGLRRFSEAGELFAQGENDIVRSNDAALQQRHLLGQYLALYQGLGDQARTMEVLARFSVRCADLTRALRSNILIDTGKLKEADAEISPVLSRKQTDAGALMIALENAAESAAHQGQTSRARRLLGNLMSLAHANEHSTQRASVTATYQHAMCHLLDGQVGTVVTQLEADYHDMLRDGDPVMRGLAGIIFGAALIRHGRVSNARMRVLDAVAAMSEAYVGDALPWALAILCQAQALAGESSAARTSLAESERLRQNRRISRFERDFVLADASVAMVDGRLTDAVEICLKGAAGCGEFVLHQADLLHSALRYGAKPSVVRPQLDDIAASVDSPLVGQQAEHAAALENDDADVLLAIARQWANDGALMRAAEISGQAADAYERQRDRVEALRAQEMSRALWDRCDGVDARLRVTVSPPVKLSGREQEIVSLAAAGLHNGEIAERLVLSVRTVESHLYSAFSKIGISRRTDLPTVGLPDHEAAAPNEGQ